MTLTELTIQPPRHLPLLTYRDTGLELLCAALKRHYSRFHAFL